MKSAGGLFAHLGDPAFLERAALLTVRGKRRRADVSWFLFRKEEIVERLATSIALGLYRPAGYRLIAVRDPKPRVIAAAPIEDRIVHTAVVLLIEPVFVRSLIDDAYACRPGLGTHRALLRLLQHVRRFRFAVHLDVRSYFPSIDLEILRSLLKERIRETEMLELLDRILDAGADLYDPPDIRRLARMDPDWPPKGQGLPIGALTSQLFAAHVYLCGFDHFVKRALRVPGYVRYVDDFYLFGNSRSELRAWRHEVGRYLADRRRLRLKVPLSRILSCTGHLDALGHRVTREGILPLERNWKTLRARVAEEAWRSGKRARRRTFPQSASSLVGNLLFGTVGGNHRLGPTAGPSGNKKA